MTRGEHYVFVNHVLLFMRQSEREGCATEWGYFILFFNVSVRMLLCFSWTKANFITFVIFFNSHHSSIFTPSSSMQELRIFTSHTLYMHYSYYTLLFIKHVLFQTKIISDSAWRFDSIGEVVY